MKLAWLPFFVLSAYATSALGLACVGLAAVYFAKRGRDGEGADARPILISASGAAADGAQTRV